MIKKMVYEKNICKNCINKAFNPYGCQNERSIAGSANECGNHEVEKIILDREEWSTCQLGSDRSETYEEYVEKMKGS